jgi:riboflavin synthase
MFTGIARGLGTLACIREQSEIKTLTFDHHGLLDNELRLGNSVLVNGVCLTIVKVAETQLDFDVIPETLRLTNLGQLQLGDRVNVEPSLKLADEIGGHKVEGHVEGLAEIVDIKNESSDYRVTFQINAKALYPAIVHKGYIAIDGVSLTVAGWDNTNGRLEIALIPETLERTTLGFKKAGDQVNVETDISNRVIANVIGLHFSDIERRLKTLEDKINKRG